MHRDWKTYRKYRKDKFRFHFNRFFPQQAVVAKLLDPTLISKKKNGNLIERSRILKIVSDYVNEYLYPSKYKLL